MADVKKTVEEIRALQEQIDEKRELLAGNAEKAIDELVSRAYKLIREAEELAVASGESFEFSIEYGMGGTFDPDTREWNSSSSMC